MTAGRSGCGTSLPCSTSSHPHPSLSTGPLPKPGLPPLDDQYGGEIIDRVFGYMLDNLAGDVSMSTAADLIGMSHSAFSRYFKRMSGQTFTDTVRKLRLAHACKLLKDSDLPIASICTRVGYTNLSNFNRQFRAQHGLTPRFSPSQPALIDLRRASQQRTSLARNYQFWTCTALVSRVAPP